jgi:hypothetical protein
MYVRIMLTETLLFSKPVPAMQRQALCDAWRDGALARDQATDGSFASSSLTRR